MNERDMAIRIAKATVKDKDADKQVQKAVKLNGVDPELAKFLSTSGLKDGDSNDDKIAVKKTSVSASSLKPSQTTIRLDKVVGMAIGMLRSGKIGGDLGAIISSDNQIMDGHHRWAATIIAGGSKGKVGGYKASLSGSELIRVLNILTKGKFGRNQGNAGSGNIADINQKKVKKVLEDAVENGISGDFPIPKKAIEDALVKKFGSVEEGIKTMSDNANKISKSIPGWAPSRSDMPVISPSEVGEAAKMMNQGQVNWKKPFEVKSALIAVAKMASEIRED